MVFMCMYTLHIILVFLWLQYSTDYVAEAVFKVIHDASMNGVLLMVRERDGMNLVKLHVKKSAKL